MGKLKYRFKGDRPVILREQLVKPGDSYDTDEEVVHGEFEPANQPAKDAAAATEKLNASLNAPAPTESAAAAPAPQKEG